MKLRKLLAIVLAGAMAVTMLAACGGKDEGAAQPAAQEEAAGAEEAADAGAEATWDEVTEISVYLLNAGNMTEEGQKRVQDAMNAITEKTAGVHANINYLTIGDAITQVGLMLASGADFDVMGLGFGPASYSMLMANKQLLDITEYMEEDGQDILNTLGDYIKVNTLGGQIYGIPCFRNYAMGGYLVMRTDVLEELGLVEEAEGLKSWTEAEALFEKVYDAKKLAIFGDSKKALSATVNTSIIVPGKVDFKDVMTYDMLNDSLYLMYAGSESDNLTARPLLDSYRKQQDMIRDWYQKGWIYKDSEINGEDNGDVLQSNGVIFAQFTPSEYGIEAMKEQAMNCDLTVLDIVQVPVDSYGVNHFGMAIPVTCDEPEASVRWVNELFKSPELMNLVTWGIEGEDYVLLDDGRATFPEGKDFGSVGYHNQDFTIGNHFLIAPWDSQDADFRDQELKVLRESPMSPYFGFQADTNDLSNTISQLTVVTDKYTPGIYCGNYTDEYYDEFVNALKSAGIDDYIAAYQQQLDAWKAAN